MKLAINGGSPVRIRPWTSPHPVDREDEQILLEALYQTDWSDGRNIKTFESEFAKYCGCSYAILVTNGTAAFKLALMAADIGQGDEVIVPGLTWPSMITSIIECGAIPVPVDINLDTFGLDIDNVQKALTKKTKALIPTHLYCSQTDMPPLLELAGAENLFVIEDAAHVVGTKRFEKNIGTFGNIGIFSFNQKKLLACGEGGCLVTNDENLYESAKKYREIDLEYQYTMEKLPGVYRISEFQAALLLSQLKKLDRRLKEIEYRAERLRKKLESMTGIIPLKRLPSTNIQSFYSFCFRVINYQNIEWFRAALSKELGLRVSGAYTPLSETKIYSTEKNPYTMYVDRLFRKQLKNCMQVHFAEAVRFPHYALATDDEAVEDIAEAILKILYSGG